MPHWRVWLPLCVTAAAAVAGTALWAQQGTRPAYAAPAHASRPAAGKTASAEVTQVAPATARPTPAAASPSPSPSASGPRTPGWAAEQRQAGQRKATQQSTAESAAEIKARAEQLTSSIGKSKLTIHPRPLSSPFPTQINVGG